MISITIPVSSLGSALTTGAEVSADGLMLTARWVPSGRPTGSRAALIAAASRSGPSPHPCAWANHASGERFGESANRDSAS